MKYTDSSVWQILINCISLTSAELLIAGLDLGRKHGNIAAFRRDDADQQLPLLQPRGPGCREGMMAWGSGGRLLSLLPAHVPPACPAFTPVHREGKCCRHANCYYYFLIIKRHPGNYRSMSSLSILAKLIVELIKDRQVQHSDKCNTTGSIQCGF